MLTSVYMNAGWKPALRKANEALLDFHLGI
jgi:hypothetical protein